MTDHPVDSRCLFVSGRPRLVASATIASRFVLALCGHVRAWVVMLAVHAQKKSKRGAGITVGLVSGELGWVVFSRGRLTRLPGVNSPLVANPQRESPVRQIGRRCAPPHVQIIGDSSVRAIWRFAEKACVDESVENRFADVPLESGQTLHLFHGQAHTRHFGVLPPRIRSSAC